MRSRVAELGTWEVDLRESRGWGGAVTRRLGPVSDWSRGATVVCGSRPSVGLRRFSTGGRMATTVSSPGTLEATSSRPKPLHREAKEEGASAISGGALNVWHGMHQRLEDEGGRFGSVVFWFLCRERPGHPFNREPHRCEELSWFAVTALPDNIACMPDKRSRCPWQVHRTPNSAGRPCACPSSDNMPE